MDLLTKLNPMRRKISVIIPTYHDWSRLKLCVSALERQSFPKEDFEVIIVNNDPLDPAPEDFILPNNILLIGEAKPGSYAARNAGIKIAMGEILAFTDSDCIPDEDWLENAYSNFKDSPIDLIGGKVKLFKAIGGSNLIHRYETHRSFRQDINVPKGKCVTANLFVRKGVILKSGGFNSDLKSGGDWEFSTRCVKNGYKMKYCENVVVNHPSRKNLNEILMKQRRTAAWGIINASQNQGVRQWVVVFRQFKNGLIRTFFPKYLEGNFFDRFVVFSIDLVKVHHRLFIGILIMRKVINPLNIRE